MNRASSPISGCPPVDTVGGGVVGSGVRCGMTGGGVGSVVGKDVGKGVGDDYQFNETVRFPQDSIHIYEYHLSNKIL